MKLDKNIIAKIIKVFGPILFMITLMVIYSKVLEYKQLRYEENLEIEKKDELFSKIEKNNYAFMDKYTIYGNHLNIGGFIEKNTIEDIDIKSLKIVLIDIDKNEREYDLNFNIEENRVIYYLSNNINEGIDLESINEGNYYVFLKLKGSIKDKEETKYFSLKNNTKYASNEYYTLTKNGKNNKINIEFSKYGQDNIEYMKITSKETILPDDVYDIVLDPGHGGKDSGAMYNEKKECKYTLIYAHELKKELESLGYKVKLTREKDEYVTPYGKDGRALIPYKVKAKLFLSIHLNSTASDKTEGGVEIYLANNMNTDFAKKLADNIVQKTGTRYSANNISKVLEGVYVKTYTQEEVEEAIEYAHDLGYEPYESLSTQTPYFFMIRETGGIMTHAYIDGRNKSIGDNPYFNSNISSEAYLLELGFINSENDFNNLINNRESYINAIVGSIVQHYNK